MVTIEGDKVKLICNATNDEDSTDPINWYNGTQLLRPDGKHVIIYNEHDNVTNQLHSILVLDSVNHTDDGEYICQAFTYPFCFVENTINHDCQM